MNAEPVTPLCASAPRFPLRTLSIAGAEFVISSEFPLPLPFDAFSSQPPSGDPVSIVVLTKPVVEPPGVRLSRERELSFWRQEDKDSIVLEEGDGTILGCLTCDPAWKSATLGIRQGCDHVAILKILTEVFFRMMLCRQGRGLVLHASGVSQSGYGLAFVGPSGMGKSTQARLWEGLRGAVVLNDDRPAVTLESRGPMLHGTPWSGASDKRMARSVSLQALVFLEQAPVNAARHIPPAEALSRLLPRVFLPYSCEAGMASVLATIERLLKNVRVLHLACRPDVEAVDCLEKALLNL